MVAYLLVRFVVVWQLPLNQIEGTASKMYENYVTSSFHVAQHRQMPAGGLHTLADRAMLRTKKLGRDCDATAESGVQCGGLPWLHERSVHLGVSSAMHRRNRLCQDG
jgi:hypothetical protein